MRRTGGVLRTAPRAMAWTMAGVLAISLAGCIGYDGDVQHGYVIDQTALAQIKPGTSAEQVLSVLGTPSTTSTVGGDSWYYVTQQTVRPLAFMDSKITDQRVLAVYFQNKKVVRLANYGIQDGKIFDFVSRTTPTGGTEPSLLRNILKNFLNFSS